MNAPPDAPEGENHSDKARSSAIDEARLPPSLEPVNHRSRCYERMKRHIFLMLPFCMSSLYFSYSAVRTMSASDLYVAIILCLIGVAFPWHLASNPYAVDCVNCGASISSSIDWVCGLCKSTNPRFFWTSFFDNCKNPICRATAKVLFCPHCTTPLLLNGRPAVKPYAFVAGKIDPFEKVKALENQEDMRQKAAMEAEEAAKKERKDKREEKFEDIDYKTRLARGLTDQLKAEIGLWETQQKFAEAKKNRTAPKQSAEEQLQTDLERRTHKDFLAFQIADKAKRVCDEEHKGNPELRERKHIVIDDWLEEQTSH